MDKYLDLVSQSYYSLYFNLQTKMQQHQSQNNSALPPEEQQPTTPRNTPIDNRAIPTFQTITNTQYITSRKSKSKPKGLLLTQAAEIKKLNQSLSEYKNKFRYMSLQRERIDRESYENHIRQLIDSDNSKKNQIEKLSLTIRSLISSCEAYRKEIGTTNQKIRKVEDFNHELLKKYEALDQQNQMLKKSFQDYKKDKEKELETVNKQFSLNQNYSQALQRNVQELMKRVNQIPNFERDLQRLSQQNTFWKQETQRLNNELATMDQLYINSKRKNVEHQERHKNSEDKRIQLQKQLKKTQTLVTSLQSQISRLNEQAQSHEVTLYSKNQAYEVQSQQVIQHKNQTTILEDQIKQKDHEIKQKNKLIISLQKQITRLNQEQKGYDDFRKYYNSEISRITIQKDGDLAALNSIIDEQKEKEKNLRFLLQQRERDTMAQKKKIEQLEMQLIKVSSQLHFCEADKQILLKEISRYRERDESNEAIIVKMREQLRAKTIDNQTNTKRIDELSEQLKTQMTKGLELYSKFKKMSEQDLKKDESILRLSSKIQVFQKATANLKSRLSEQTSKNKTIQARLSTLQAQHNKKVEQLQQAQDQLSKLQLENESLRVQRQQLNKMIINKTGEGQQIKRKMIIIQNQLIEQFDNNLNESNRLYQDNFQRLEKENDQLSKKLLAQEDSHKQLQIYIADEEQVMFKDHSLRIANEQKEDYKERARKIEKKLQEYRQVKREFQKLKKSLQKTVDQNEKLKQELKRQQLQSSTHFIKSSTLAEQKERLTEQRNQIAKMLQNKTKQCEKLKRKLIEMQDQLRAFFQASIKTELRSHRQHIEKLQKQKEDIQEVSKTSLKRAYQILEQENKKRQQLLKASGQQNQKLKTELTEFNSKYEQAVSKLLQELERLQSILGTTQQKQASDATNYSTKLQQIQTELKSVEQQLLNERKTSQSQKIMIEQYQCVLTKLQDEFIALQLLVNQLKQQRSLFMKKNGFMTKGIHTVHEEMQRLDSSAQKISKLFHTKSSIHEDIGKHYDIIQGAFASLEKFKIVEVKVQIQEQGLQKVDKKQSQ